MALRVPIHVDYILGILEYHSSDLYLPYILWTVLVSSQAFGLVRFRPTFPLPSKAGPSISPGSKAMLLGPVLCVPPGPHAGSGASKLEGLDLITWVVWLSSSSHGCFPCCLLWSSCWHCLSGLSARTSGLRDLTAHCRALPWLLYVRSMQWDSRHKVTGSESSCP